MRCGPGRRIDAALEPSRPRPVTDRRHPPAPRKGPMDLRKLKTLIDLVSESNITELEIAEADGKVRIVKAGTSQPAAHPAAGPVTQYVALPTAAPPATVVDVAT